MTPFKHHSPFRWLRWLLSFLFMAATALYIIFPFCMGVAAVFPSREGVGLPPVGFSTIHLTTADNVPLVGWYAPPANGSVIILLHGAGGSRENVRAYAEMLMRNGYGVLALDLRGHGESGGKVNRLGWQGTLDVGAAVAYLEAQDAIERIGGLGLSMGGEVLLGAASAYPQLTVIVADGATRRCTDELLSLPSERSLVRNFTARVFYASVQLLSGERPPSPALLDSMQIAETTRFYLVAAGANPLEIRFNQLFADTLGARAALWIAPNASHMTAFSLYPQEYEQRVIAFLAEWAQ